jgi:hypothetical protein
VVINYLDVKGITIAPNETDAILIIDADTVLPFPIVLQNFKLIPWKDCKITQAMCSVQLQKFSLRDSGNSLKSL